MLSDSPIPNENLRPPHQLHAHSRPQFLHPPGVDPEISFKVDSFPASSSFGFWEKTRTESEEGDQLFPNVFLDANRSPTESQASEEKKEDIKNSPAFSKASFHLLLSLHPAPAIPPTNNVLNLGCSLLNLPDLASTRSMLGEQ